MMTLILAIKDVLNVKIDFFVVFYFVISKKTLLVTVDYTKSGLQLVLLEPSHSDIQ